MSESCAGERLDTPNIEFVFFSGSVSAGVANSGGGRHWWFCKFFVFPRVHSSCAQGNQVQVLPCSFYSVAKYSGSVNKPWPADLCIFRTPLSFDSLRKKGVSKLTLTGNKPCHELRRISSAGGGQRRPGRYVFMLLNRVRADECRARNCSHPKYRGVLSAAPCRRNGQHDTREPDSTATARTHVTGAGVCLLSAKESSFPSLFVQISHRIARAGEGNALPLPRLRLPTLAELGKRSRDTRLQNKPRRKNNVTNSKRHKYDGGREHLHLLTGLALMSCLVLSPMPESPTKFHAHIQSCRNKDARTRR